MFYRANEALSGSRDEASTITNCARAGLLIEKKKWASTTDKTRFRRVSMEFVGVGQSVSRARGQIGVAVTMSFPSFHPFVYCYTSCNKFCINVWREFRLFEMAILLQITAHHFNLLPLYVITNFINRIMSIYNRFQIFV